MFHLCNGGGKGFKRNMAELPDNKINDKNRDDMIVKG